MEIRENDKICIFAPLTAHLDAYESERLLKNISSEIREVAVDLQYTQDCTLDFIETLKKISKERQIGIFNIPSEIFILFNIMGIDKITKLFVSELDFEDNQRQLINRKFSIV